MRSCGRCGVNMVPDPTVTVDASLGVPVTTWVATNHCDRCIAESSQREIRRERVARARTYCFEVREKCGCRRSIGFYPGDMSVAGLVTSLAHFEIKQPLRIMLMSDYQGGTALERDARCRKHRDVAPEPDDDCPPRPPPQDDPGQAYP